MIDPVQQFKDVMRTNGLEPPDVIEPGKFYRFPGVGKKKGNNAAWCILFADGMGGAFGDYSSGFSGSWQARCDRALTKSEEEAVKRQIYEAVKQAEIRRKKEETDASMKAVPIWEQAQPAKPGHRYLVKKNVKAHSLRQSKDGRLILPLRDATGTLVSLQYIDKDGNKRFLKGGRVIGCYYLINSQHGAGLPDDVQTICICEGFATGATIHEATGYPIAVAFHSGNLKAVAEVIRAMLPNSRIILCADNDAATEGNPGITKAKQAALAVGGFIAVPNFGTGGE